ncbi:MAG: NAD-dependent epimerase/dehydratase family protein [Pirellulales bacterium]
MAKLVFGCGYLGSRVASAWRAAGHDVYVVTRSSRRADELAGEGYRPLLADVTLPDDFPQWPPAETVLYAVGYDRKTANSIEQIYVGGLANVLDSLPAGAAPANGMNSVLQGRFIYISSTGVYGDSRGALVNEDTPCNPERAGGKACLAAEQLLLAGPLARRAVILRMAGIYGPGRLPNLKSLLAGDPLAAAGEAHLNLIHVDDAVAAVLAAERVEVRLPRTYLVSDGAPGLRRDFYAQCARLVGAPPPRFEAPAAPQLSRGGAADKRISNARMMAELGVVPRYGSYREGLAQIASGAW